MYHILAFTGAIIVISALSIRLTRHFKIPILAIYLIFGIFLGSFGIHFGIFGSYIGIQTISIIALCYILFSGALEMDLSKVKNIQKEGLVLATFGIIVTTIIVGYIVRFVFPDFSLIECFLFGAIVSSTDAAAVMSALNFRKMNISEDLKNLLKFESGSNDPMAFTLLLTLLAFLDPMQVSPNIALSSVKIFIELGIGILWGWIFAKFGLYLLNTLSAKIYEFDHILILGLVIATFGVSQLALGNGFLSVYIFGLYLTQDNFQYKKNTVRFYSTISGVFEVFMFIGLGIIVDFSMLLALWKEGLILAIATIFLARPAAVFLSLTPFKKYSIGEQIFISWGGLKGAVPIIFATYPVVVNIPNGLIIFHLIFFCVLVSILLQGLTLDNCANLFKLQKEPKDNDIQLQEHIPLQTLENIEEQLIEIKVLSHSFFVNKEVKDLKLPIGTLIITIERGGSYFSPVFNTQILEEDLLFIMSSDKKNFQKYIKENSGNFV